MDSDKVAAEKKIGFYLKDIISLMSELFLPLLTSPQNMLTKSNLKKIEKDLTTLNSRLNDLMMMKTKENHQYLLFMDAFWLFYTVLLDRIMQSCLFRAD